MSSTYYLFLLQRFDRETAINMLVERKKKYVIMCIIVLQGQKFLYNVLCTYSFKGCQKYMSMSKAI